jgi:hypothetical protein
MILNRLRFHVIKSLLEILKTYFHPDRSAEARKNRHCLIYSSLYFLLNSNI